MSGYLKYVLKNIEPIRIADDSSSQNGQTSSLKYIPGSSIRGIVVNALARETDFEEIKKILFSTQIRYLNAYLSVGEKVLLPSPKGFYEDKTIADGKKEISNLIINGEFPAGQKRASLGRFCYMEDDCIHYYGIASGSDMKIKINFEEKEKKLSVDENQSIFRNEYIAPGYLFTGYIAVEDEHLKERIKSVMEKDILIGNARSAGFGKCKVLSCEYVTELPYEEYMPQKDLEKSCYLMLLSHCAMRDENGELCGISLKQLQEKMGVTNLNIAYCSTSTVTVHGYNRVWGSKIPSNVMFEQGSVFHLTYEGILTVEKMKKLAEEGIGIRRNEGFGRILFLKDYEKITYKMAESDTRKMLNWDSSVTCTEEEKEVLKIVAKNYYRNQILHKMQEYIVENPLKMGGLSNSQLGTLESILIAHRYDTQKAKKILADYMQHMADKESRTNIQKAGSNISSFREIVQNIFSVDLEMILGMKEKKTIMGIEKTEIFSQSDFDKMKITLLIDMIRYKNKKGDE